MGERQIESREKQTHGKSFEYAMLAISFICVIIVLIIVMFSYGGIWFRAYMSGAEVTLCQVPELIPDEALERIGAKAARAQFAHIPVAAPETMLEADAIIFGTPTGFGNMAPQMQNYLDQTGAIWAKPTIRGEE